MKNMKNKDMIMEMVDMKETDFGHKKLSARETSVSKS